MVYLHFPSQFTEEEQMLQAKYQKLKRKKKALQTLKAPKPEPEKTATLKRPTEAKEAKEIAKKLLKSGAIHAIKKPENKGEKTTFKRSRGLERRLSGSERALTPLHTPSALSPPPEKPSPLHDKPREPREPKPKVKNLYDTFVAARDREERGLVDAGEYAKRERRSGNTIYVFGYNITEELLKRAFQPFGNIINISMEIEKNCGFITFDKTECTDRAISSMNGSMVSGVQLKVSLARRQPIIEPINDASSSATWSTIAASHSQKGSHKDKRGLISYDEDIF
ncbi:unnamed protein product [Darwinula stevensoni]|uniref:Negative elongation factor E n=1 Tax=Darwinula stevensoni TaxID=69355 RepID=A0A7R8ZXX3_9CRUS|nr:unnamed protein product [Darwinula stevensoni]CAG0879271.1 unnamed protein product [Darwinula stevensoni]